MYRSSLVGWEQIICKPWQTLAVHLWLTNDNRFRPKLQFVVSMEKPNVVKACLKLYLDISGPKVSQHTIKAVSGCARIAVLCQHTVNMGHIETSVQSTVNHCNQVYSYSTVVFIFDCCSKCSEITVNLKYIQWIIVPFTLLHCTVYGK